MRKGQDPTAIPYQNRHRTPLQRALSELPGLCISVRCTSAGVNVSVCLHNVLRDGQRGMEYVTDVTFRPPEVTEDLVVQWAIGAASAYLQRKAEAVAEAVAASS